MGHRICQHARSKCKVDLVTPPSQSTMRYDRAHSKDTTFTLQVTSDIIASLNARMR